MCAYLCVYDGITYVHNDSVKVDSTTSECPMRTHPQLQASMCVCTVVRTRMNEIVCTGQVGSLSVSYPLHHPNGVLMEHVAHRT